MRGIASYFIAAVIVVSGLELVVPAEWTVPVRASAMVERGSTLQHVDRTHKSDRLMAPVTVVDKTPAVAVREQVPPKPAKILEGCDPVFSPLSASAHQANLPGRCAV